MVALTSQGLHTSLSKVAVKGQETDGFLAFRLRAVGKIALSIRGQTVLRDILMACTVYGAEAIFGWLLFLTEKIDNFDLVVHQKLPFILVNKLGRNRDEAISSQVAPAGEMLTIKAVTLKRFKSANRGQSVASVPNKGDKKGVRILKIIREKNFHFQPGKRSTNNVPI